MLTRAINTLIGVAGVCAIVVIIYYMFKIVVYLLPAFILLAIAAILIRGIAVVVAYLTRSIESHRN
jgi:hypothetical protein